MPLFGKIVVIRRDGVDGAQFPLTTGTCIFGRNADCDIRVQLPNVAKEHCRIEVEANGNIFLVNLCPLYPTLLNKKVVTERVQVQHLDVFTVTDRSFRVEFPPGSPFRKSCPSTDTVSPPQPTGSVKSENVPEPFALVKDEKSLPTNTEQSAAEKEGSSSKAGIKYTPKGRTPIAKARTPAYSARTPLQKGSAASPAVKSSAKLKTKTPTSVGRGTRTPLVGQRNTNVKSTVTPKSKSSVSLSKSDSSLLADEIAELKLALTKAKGQTPARTSVPKTPVGTGHFSGAPVKAKTPAAGDRTKTPSLTPRVRSNLAPTPKSKTLISASVVKTPAVTPAAKTPLTSKSKGLATKTSSVHRIKKVMTPSPKATTQRRRSSSVPSHVTEITARPPLRNIVPQTDSLDASQDQQQEVVEPTLETSLGDKTFEIADLAVEKSPSQKFSPAKTFGRPRTGSFPSGPSTPRAKLSPATRSSSSALTRRKLHSPGLSPAKSSPQKMSLSAGKTLAGKTMTAKRRSSSSSSVGADKVAKDTPPHQIPSRAQAEAVDSNLEVGLRDKSSDDAVLSSDEQSRSLVLTPAEGLARRTSRSSKVSSPGERASRVSSLSSNVSANTSRKSLSPLTRSPGSSLTRSKSQSPFGGPGKTRTPQKGSAESSPDKVVPESVGTPGVHQQRSSTRRSVVVKQSPLPGKSPSPLIYSAESSAEELSQVVESPALLPRRSSNRASVTANQSLIDEVLLDTRGPTTPEAQIQVRSRKKSQSSLTKSPSPSTRSRPQTPRGVSAESSAQKKRQSSQMSPVGEDNAKRELQSALESPTDASQSLSQSLTKSSTRSKSQSPRRPADDHSTQGSLQMSNDSPRDSINRRKSRSPKGFPGETSAGRKSQYLEVSTPLGKEDGIPAVTDDFFLEPYEQQFSPLILEMDDDLDETKDSPQKSTPVVGPKSKGINDPESLKSAVGRLRRKSQPLLEESEDETFSTKTAGKENDTSAEIDESSEERSFVSPSQGVKRRGGPLKGLPTKRRCVSFGPDVSPELFDRSLPVATPLKRGATPRRTSSSVVRMAIQIQPKPLLKNRRSTLSTAAATVLEEPLEVKRTGKSPKDLKVAKKLSKGVGQKSPVPESTTTLNAKAATDLEASQSIVTPIRRQTKPRRASVAASAAVSPKSLRKSRRATLSAPWVTTETALEENTEKSPKSSKVMESAVVVNVMASVDAEAASEVQTPVSSAVSPVAVGSQNRKIFTSGSGGKRLSRALRTPPATEVANSNENSPAVKSARKEKTTKLHNSLSPRSSLPLTNMQNSSVLHQEADPFAFESSPETSPAKLTPKPISQSKDTSVLEDLTTRNVLQSVKKKLQEEMTTPKVPLDFTVAGSSTCLLKSLRSVGRSSGKDVDLEQEDELQETPTAITTEGLRSTGRRSSKPVNKVVYETSTETTPNIPGSTGRRSSKPVNEAVCKTPVEATPNIPRSTGRRSSRLPDKEDEKHSAELTPVADKSTGRRSKSSSNLPSATKTDAKTKSEQDPVSEGKRSKSFGSAAKTPRSVVGKRGLMKSEESLKTPDVEMTGKASAASPALPSGGEGTSAKRQFSARTSSSPFKRPFDSEPRKLRLGQIGDLFRQSPEEARRAARSKITARQMISERNIDLSSLSPLKFYKSPAADALTGKWSKATPSRAVALRAVYGKSAVPPLAELRVSRKAPEMTDAGKSEMAGAAAAESSPAEKSRGSKLTKRKKSSLQVAAKKKLEKKTGFAVKKKQTKVLLKRVGRRSVGQVVKKLVPARQRNLLQSKSNSAQKGQNALPKIAENDVLEVLPEKGQAVAESSKSPSCHSVPITPNGPGEMSVSPWSSPVESGKRRSGGKAVVAVETSKGPKSPSSAGPKRILASPGAGDSSNLNGMNLTVEKSPVESSPLLIGVRQLVKTSNVEVSPQLSGVRNLVKTPKVQKSPKLSGVKNLLKTPKVQKSPKLGGVKNLVKTPKVQKSPKLSGLRNLMKTPKPEKSPKLIGVRNMLKTPKEQKSPKLSGVRELVKTPKVQKSPKLIGVKKLVKSPRVQKSPLLIGVKKLVKTPKVQKSPRLSGVKDLMRTPKVQESSDLTEGEALCKSFNQLKTPQLGGLKDLPSTPKVLNSPESKPMNELIQSPAIQSSPQPSSTRKKVKTPETQQSAKRASTQKKVVKTPKHKRSPRLGGVKPVVKTPKMQPTPKLSGLRKLMRTPKEIPSPQLEGVRELIQTPVVQQQSAKKTSVKKSPVESPEVIEFYQFLADLSLPDDAALKQVRREIKSLKSSVTPVVGETKEPQDVAPLEDATPVRPAKRLQKRAVRAGAGKAKNIPQLSTEVVQNDKSVGNDDKTAAVKQTRKRKIVESDEGPAAQKRRVDAETEDKGLHSAVKKGRGAKKVAAETLTRPSEIKVAASNIRGRLRKEIEESSVAQEEKPQVMSAALSSKLAASGNSRSQKAKTAQVEQVTVEENVPVTVEESVIIGARRQARSSKKDLPEEAPAVKSEEKVKSKVTAKGKGKTKQAELETGADNVEVSAAPSTEVSDGRRQGRAKKTAIKEVVHAEAVVNKVERKTKSRGKAITTEVEEKVATEQAAVEKTVESSSSAVKVSNVRRKGRAQVDANEELTVQSKAIVIEPERKSRAGARGKAKQSEVEVEPSVKETAKIGSRQQVRSVKKGTSEKEADVQTEGVVNKAGRKVGGRGKSKTPLTEEVEENPEKTAEPNVRKKKQTAKKDEVASVVDAGDDKTVEGKRPVRGRKTKLAEGKGRTITSEEASLTVDGQTSQSAVAPSGKRGRKGVVVEPSTSEADIITEVVQSSRKRKAKIVEEIAPTKSKKARVEATTVEATKEASPPKPSKRGSKKAATGVADKKVDNNLVTKKLSTADKELAEKPAARQNKRNALIAKVSSAIDEEFKTNSLEKKQGGRSSNKAKSAETSESPKRKNTVTSLKQQKTIKQANEVEPGQPRTVKFDVAPAPAADGLEKAAQSTARGRGATKRGSEDKAVSKDLQTAKPKANASRSVIAKKDTAPVSGKRALRASKK